MKTCVPYSSTATHLEWVYTQYEPLRMRWRSTGHWYLVFTLWSIPVRDDTHPKTMAMIRQMRGRYKEQTGMCTVPDRLLGAPSLLEALLCLAEDDALRKIRRGSVRRQSQAKSFGHILRELDLLWADNSEFRHGPAQVREAVHERVNGLLHDLRKEPASVFL